MSRPLSDEMQAYVMSVVCGDDLVPRLSVAAVEKLKQELEEALVQCPLSKVSLSLALSGTGAGTDTGTVIVVCHCVISKVRSTKR